MECFTDIIKHAIKNKMGVGLITFYSIIIAIVYIIRNYLLGRIVKNLDINDLYKYVGLTLITFAMYSLLHFKINNETIEYNETIFGRFLEIFFKSNFNDILKHNESILSDMNESIQNIGGATQIIYSLFIQQFILIFATIIIFLYKIKSVGIILIGTIILIIFVQKYLISKLREVWEVYWKYYTDFNKQFQDVMLNIWSVKYNTLENITQVYLKDKFKKRMNLLKKWLDLKVLSLEIPDFSFFIVIVYNLYILINNKDIDTTLRVFSILQLFKIWKEFRSMCQSTTDVYQNIKYSEKICPIWLLEEKEKPKETDLKTDIIHTIEFNNVSYGYTSTNILNKMSFKINKGQAVSLLGKSGSGKSTIINLMCRLYDVEKGNGSVLINNTDVKDHNVQFLRDCINVVPQNFNVFDMTIKENIVLEDKYDEKRMKFLVKLLNLPDITLSAKTLSHGQKQRVIIGRTLYREYKSVYIFDEYLSAVDQTQAKIIHDYVLDFIRKNNKIGIFISHNPERTYSTDKIIKL